MCKPALIVMCTIFVNVCESVFGLTQCENLPKKNTIWPNIAQGGIQVMKNTFWCHPLQGQEGLNEWEEKKDKTQCKKVQNNWNIKCPQVGRDFIFYVLICLLSFTVLLTLPLEM